MVTCRAELYTGPIFFRDKFGRHIPNQPVLLKMSVLFPRWGMLSSLEGKNLWHVMTLISIYKGLLETGLVRNLGYVLLGWGLKDLRIAGTNRETWLASGQCLDASHCCHLQHCVPTKWCTWCKCVWFSCEFYVFVHVCLCMQGLPKFFPAFWKDLSRSATYVCIQTGPKFHVLRLVIIFLFSKTRWDRILEEGRIKSSAIFHAFSLTSPQNQHQIDISQLRQ